MKRRTILKGSAVTLLPSLSGSLFPSAVRAANSVLSSKNLVICVTNLGFNDTTFSFEKDKLDKSNLVSQLKNHYSQLTVMKNIMHPAIDRGHGGSAGILTCNRKQKNGPFISIDQFATERLIQRSTVKHLCMADRGLVFNKGSRPATSFFQKNGVASAFDHIFKPRNLDQLKEKHRFIDSVVGEVPRHAKGNYEQAIREFEETLESEVKWGSAPIPKVEFDTKLHLTDHHQRGFLSPFEQYLELVRLGIKHKRCQVAVLSPPHIDKTNLGTKGGGYHKIGHNQHQSKDFFESMLKIESHIFTAFSGFLDKLKKDGTLDDTIVLFMGGFSNPGGHSRKYLPTILAGGGFKHQGALECRSGDQFKHSLSDLYVSILHQMGIENVSEFAQSAGNMDAALGV
jgi:hypothetical protein